jgi:DNA polymerase-3 subunit gamma/tau
VSYRVFARKYRPQRFEEVVGQEHITRTLQNAITGKRLAQAYLFVGPRGVGKTSSARILAKALNCLANKGEPTDNPCGVCDACVEIAEGRSLDVIEIDGASNNSVESVRTLRENAAYAPARGPFKVYLIDEVHMLSTAAFNALLKTLEEPPEHVKFLFATTEAQKVPATILSRCQRFDLRRLTPELIAGHLLQIAANEKIAIDPAAAAAIARGADGAMRDAESMLDQVVAFCGNTITAADVQNVFGFTPRETVLGLAAALLVLDTPGALAVVKEQAEAGKDLARLLGDLVGLLRDILIGKVHPPQEPTDESRLGESVTQEKLLVLLDHFGEAEGRLRWATDKKLQLDVALIKGIHLLGESSLSDVIEALTALRGGAPIPERAALPPAPTRPTAPASSKTPEPKVSPLPATATQSVPAKVEHVAATTAPVNKEAPQVEVSAKAEDLAEPASAPAPIAENPSSAAPAASDPWSMVANQLSADSPLKFGWTEDGKFIERIGNAILVEFPPSMEHQTKTLFWPQAVKKIEEQLSALIGGKIAFECRFTGEEPPAPPEPEPVAAPQPKSSTSAPKPKFGEQAPKAPEPAVPAISPEELEAFKNDPLIKKALEIFKAEILLDPPKPA